MKKSVLVLAICLCAGAGVLLAAGYTSSKPAATTPKTGTAATAGTGVAAAGAGSTNALADDKARLSYAFGMMLGGIWKQQGLEVDPNMVLRGLKDSQSGGPGLMSQQEMREVITDGQQKAREALVLKNKTAGEVFLVTNRMQPGVVVLPDGLQYKVVTDGNGEIPQDNDVVKVNYRGTFVDGTEFGSSARAGKPLQLQVGHTGLRGWDEALKLMKSGSKWELYIPSDLAYGPKGLQSAIPPFSTLILDVELLSVQHSNPAPAAAPVQLPAASAPPASADAQPMTSDIVEVPSAEALKNGEKIKILKPEDVQKLQQEQQQQKQPPPATTP